MQKHKYNMQKDILEILSGNNGSLLVLETCKYALEITSCSSNVTFLFYLSS